MWFLTKLPDFVRIFKWAPVKLLQRLAMFWEVNKYRISWPLCLCWTAPTNKIFKRRKELACKFVLSKVSVNKELTEDCFCHHLLIQLHKKSTPTLSRNVVCHRWQKIPHPPAPTVLLRNETQNIHWGAKVRIFPVRATGTWLEECLSGRSWGEGDIGFHNCMRQIWWAGLRPS